MARPYISIDANVIQGALTFLISKQNADGSFREDGRVFHWDMQGGSGKGSALTAYVAIVLTENIAEFPQFKVARDKALNFLSQNVDANDVYALAIASNALYLGNHVNFTAIYTKFLSKGIETADTLRWVKSVSANPNDYSAINVEISAYALNFILNLDTVKALKLVKFLVSQKNAFGGYATSQDTVVAIRALALFSAKFRFIIGTLSLNLKPNVGVAVNAQVTPTNYLTMQAFDMNPLTRQLTVTSGAGSVGSAIVALTCNYYDLQQETSPRFLISIKVVAACRCHIKIQICLSYIPSPNDVESNMVLAKLALPSGYTYDFDNVLPSFIRVSDLKLEIFSTIFMLMTFN
jgi:CD109 antigen